MKWITFDCYGTLIDWEKGIADALGPYLSEKIDRKQLAEDYIQIEAEVERESYRKYAEILTEASGRLMALMGHPLRPENANVLLDSHKDWVPFPEVPAVLQELVYIGASDGHSFQCRPCIDCYVY